MTKKVSFAFKHERKLYISLMIWISMEKLEKYKNGEYPIEEEYYEFLKDVVEYAGYAMTDMEQRMDQSKGVSK